MKGKQKLVGWVAAGVLAAFPLAASAATTIGNNVTVGGYTSLGTIDGSNSDTNAGSLNVGNRLEVDGAVFVSSTLDVTGAVRFYALTTHIGGIISNASSSFAGGLSVNGNLSVSSTLTIAGNITPSTNNSINIGAYGSALGSVYASNTIFGTSSTLENATNTSTLYLTSGKALFGGRIVLKSPSTTNCYSLYIGDMGGFGGSGGSMGLTSTLLANCPSP